MWAATTALAALTTAQSPPNPANLTLELYHFNQANYTGKWTAHLAQPQVGEGEAHFGVAEVLVLVYLAAFAKCCTLAYKSNWVPVLLSTKEEGRKYSQAAALRRMPKKPIPAQDEKVKLMLRRARAGERSTFEPGLLKIVEEPVLHSPDAAYTYAPFFAMLRVSFGSAVEVLVLAYLAVFAKCCTLAPAYNPNWVLLSTKEEGRKQAAELLCTLVAPAAFAGLTWCGSTAISQTRYFNIACAHCCIQIADGDMFVECACCGLIFCAQSCCGSAHPAKTPPNKNGHRSVSEGSHHASMVPPQAKSAAPRLCRRH